LKSPPWDEIDASNHWVTHDLATLVNGSSVNGVETSGCIVSVRSDSGIIHRCPECRRVLRDHACADHGHVEGVKDMRLRLVIDNGAISASVLLNRASSESYLGKDMDQVTSQIDDFGTEVFVDGLRSELLGKSVTARGRCLVDEQGAMFLASELETSEVAPAEGAKAVRAKWGVAI